MASGASPVDRAPQRIVGGPGLVARRQRLRVRGPEHRTRTGLLDRDPEPRLYDLSDEELDQAEAHLARLAGGLAEARRRDAWASQPPARCRELRCGYLYRCHGTSAPSLTMD